jgi:hypothetical protein
MRLDELYLWYLADPSQPLYVGALHLVSAGKGVSLRYATRVAGLLVVNPMATGD